MGRDNRVPPHAAWRWGARRVRGVGREGRGVWGARRALTRAHAERRGRGEPRGADSGGLGVGLCVRVVGAYNPILVALVGNEREREREEGSLRPGECWPGRGLWVVARAGGNTHWWRQVPKAEGEQN